MNFYFMRYNRLQLLRLDSMPGYLSTLAGFIFLVFKSWFGIAGAILTAIEIVVKLTGSKLLPKQLHGRWISATSVTLLFLACFDVYQAKQGVTPVLPVVAENPDHATLQQRLDAALQDLRSRDIKLQDRDNEVSRATTRIGFLETENSQLRQDNINLRQQLDDRQRRARIREALGSFMLTGRALQRQCGDESKLAPNKEADDWAADVEKYLRDTLGESYVARFRSHSGLPMTGNSIQSIPHRNLWGGLDTRLARLEQFIEETTHP
jgi:hypothetical protein